jgi:signal transduction histidine kinase
MEQKPTIFENDLARKKNAIKLISVGVFALMVLSETIDIINWLSNPEILIVPITFMLLTAMLICLITYFLVRADKVRAAGHFFIAAFLFFCAIVIPLFGGFLGPLAVIYLIIILVSGIIISVNACFLVATFSIVLYLVMVGVERAGLVPQIITIRSSGYSTMVLTAQVIFSYMVAFLSWYAANSMTLAFNRLNRYSSELQIINEKLELSEKELRTSNDELLTTNEKLQLSEEELKASNEELLAANEELRDAQEQLVRSEKLAAIGKLAGGIGHELRNPLGAIKNAAYYVKGKVTSSELAKKEPRILEFLGIIDEEISSSNKIISDLLNFSRVAKPTVSPTKIRVVVEDALSRLMVPKNIEIINNLDINLPNVDIDAEQIRQVFINIADNAIQAMEKGGKITIDAKLKDKFLEVKMSDTGYGIADDVLVKIFEPLYTTRAKGIGLGLAVCKSIIERHGGEIVVESRVSEGTVFTVRLPLNIDKGVAHE